MRYAGPKMLTRHPVWAVRHIIDGWKGKSKKITSAQQIHLLR
jgi:hypothetical protein